MSLTRSGPRLCYPARMSMSPDPFSMAADFISPPPREDWTPLPHQIPPNDPRPDNPNRTFDPDYDITTHPDFNPEIHDPSDPSLLLELHDPSDPTRSIPKRSLTDWFVWLLMAGRGAGKTDAAAYYVNRYAQTHPTARIAIIAPTLGDARSACVDGPSGLLAHNPLIRVHKTPDYFLRWPSGARADIFGAHTEDDVERLRAGGNRHLVWAEELAAWRNLEDAWDQMEFGLRLGSHPHVVASTTPKNRPLIKRLMADDRVVITKGSTLDNPHLHETARARLLKRYKGTRLGKQELYGELVEDIEGALFSTKDIDATRISRYELLWAQGLLNSEDLSPEELPPDLSPQDALETSRLSQSSENGSPDPAGETEGQEPEDAEVIPFFQPLDDPIKIINVIVGVDPAISHKRQDAQTGIVTVGLLGKNMKCPFHGPTPFAPYRDEEEPPMGQCAIVFSDDTMRGSPDRWGRAVLRAYDAADADRVIGEINNGGDLVESNLRTVASSLDRPSPPFESVRASRGKAIRAEPVSSLYEQHRVHHVGELVKLEDQMTTWEPDGKDSPDRLDALVWALVGLGIAIPKRHLTLVAPTEIGVGSSYWKGA